MRSTRAAHEQNLKLSLSTNARVQPHLRLVRFNLALSGEDVVSLEGVGRVVGTEDLPGIALPLRLVDGIDVVLDLHDDAAVLLNSAAAALKTLSRLNGKRACTRISI